MKELVNKLEVTQAYVADCVEAHCERKLSAVDAAKAKWLSADVQNEVLDACVFFFSSRRRHTRCLSDWSSDVCSSDLHAWPPPPSCAESHLAIGHAWHAPPYVTSPGLPWTLPVMPSVEEQSGGTFPASLDA